MTAPKKRLEIIIDSTLQDKALKLLHKHGVTGYTILSAASGEGPEGIWNINNSIAEVGQMIIIISILDDSKMSDLSVALPAFLEKTRAICTISDVQVFRSGRF